MRTWTDTELELLQGPVEADGTRLYPEVAIQGRMRMMLDLVYHGRNFDHILRHRASRRDAQGRPAYTEIEARTIVEMTRRTIGR